jgi:DNA-binding FadR family transcriptional regulator
MGVASSSRHGRTAETLGRRILSGELRPGVSLPSENDLASAMSISRPSMREALKILTGKGLIESAPRRGAVVRPRTAWNCLDPDVLSWQLGETPNAAFVRDLCELPRIIEPEAAGCAAMRATPGALSDIENALQVMSVTETVSTASVEADVAFHQSILVASGNAFLVAFAPAIETSLRMAFGFQRQACPVSDHFVPNHRAIFEAIRRGDADGARAAVRALLVQSEADAIASLKESGR